MHGTQSHEHAEAPAAALDSVGLSVPDARQLLHYHLPSSHEAGGLSCSVFIWGPSWPCGQWHSSDTVLHGRWTDGRQLGISEYLKPSEEWRRKMDSGCIVSKWDLDAVQSCSENYTILDTGQ